MPMPIGTPTAEESAERLCRDQARRAALEYFGEAAIKGKEIHHRNGNNKDNRKENLQILDPAEHSKIHGRGHGKRGNMDLNKLKIETTEINNVEILDQGTFNGVPITEKDQDQMIENFNNKILEPYLNLDHDDNFSDSVKRALKVVSLGFVSNLSRKGTKLIANFKQVPIRVAELIEAGMLKKRSVEFFSKGFRANDKLIDNVLKAVSFFGADIPAVNSLSNDFEVLLKASSQIKEKTDPIKITFQKEKTMEIADKDYQELLTFKQKATDSNTEIEKLKKDNDDLSTKIDTTEVKLKDMQKENDDLKKFKDDSVKANEAKLKTEAEEFVTANIKDGKILPAHKDMYIADYISKSKDEATFKMFKDDVENRDKKIELGVLKTENGKTTTTNLKDMDNDKIHEAIEQKMKADGISYDEAAVKLGVFSTEEV